MSDPFQPMDCTVHGILQAEWVAISFSRGSSWPRDGSLGLPHCRQTLYCLSYLGSSVLKVKGFQFKKKIKWVEITQLSTLGFPSSSDSNASTCNAGDLSSIPGCEEPLEKEMATHSSILAWKIPWTEEPGRLYSPWGLKESDMTKRLTQLIKQLVKVNSINNGVNWHHFLLYSEKIITFIVFMLKIHALNLITSKY